MARLNAGDSEEVKLAKIRNDFELEKLKILERGKSLRFLGAMMMLTATLCMAIIAWAAVRLTEKPPWLVFVLALIACFSGQLILIIQTRQRVQRARSRRSRGRGADPSSRTEEDP